MSIETLMNPNISLHPQLTHRFNAAAWQNKDGHTVLVAREVVLAGRTGEPDKGDMVLIEMDHVGQVVRERVVWKLSGADHLVEDPRAFVCKNGEVLLGITSVVYEGSEVVPYPALAKLEDVEFKGTLPTVEVIKQFGPGKNMTPLDEKGNFLFRQEGDENNHSLLAFNWANGNATETGKINFPKDIPWALWRTGSTMPPIWVSEREALMIIHGITIENNKYIYSIGKAKLTKSDDDSNSHRYQIEVDYKPLITPDHFLDRNGMPLVEELHPELRRVVYACGGVFKKVESKLTLAIFVNVGDRQTVEVQLPWKDLTQDWFSIDTPLTNL